MFNEQKQHPASANPQFAGIHLSGPNAQKSSVLIITGRALVKPLKITAIYEKIGSVGKVFSDERLLEILSFGSPLAEVFIDCPLGEPPCVTCVEPVCPGVSSCEVVSVAYMQSMAEKIKRKGARKKRPINPQNQRLWDIYQQASMDFAEAKSFTPTYNANLAPLVVRAKTLQRRLNSLKPSIVLKETNVQLSLLALCEVLGLPGRLAEEYRSFETGSEARKSIVLALQKCRWLDDSMDAAMCERLYRSIEVFQALITSFVAALKAERLVAAKPKDYVLSESWVYCPSFASELALERGKSGVMGDLSEMLSDSVAGLISH